jgi:hypothetical protein
LVDADHIGAAMGKTIHRCLLLSLGVPAVEWCSSPIALVWIASKYGWVVV